MAGIDLADVTAGTRHSIGRYFSVVSMVPSLLLVIYAFLLAHSGASSHNPAWGAAINDLMRIGIGGDVVLIVLAIALGVGVHPIQFGLVQFLEGYWGTNPVARKARLLRITHHRNRVASLTDREENDEEASRQLDLYPLDPGDIMPTRLGNVLRRYEILAGRQYELNVLTVLPHLALAAQSEDLRYLDDQRMQLDLAVRMCFTALLATILSIALLWKDGSSVLIAGLPAGLGYVAYRGAIVSARAYGSAMATMVDMNRFALYERLHLPTPNNSSGERETNKQLMKLLEANSRHIFIRYEHPSSPSAPNPPNVVSGSPPA